MAKLAFFPIPYEDELFRSVLARYHVYSGNISDNETNLDLYGKEEKDYSLFGNSNLIKRVYQRLPVNYPVSYENMVLQHTAVPLLLRFDKEKQKAFFDTGDYYPRIRRSVHNLRYCPLCIQQEIEHYGECYWHVHHQVEGISECQIHRIKLIESDYTIRGVKRNYVLPPRNYETRYEQVSEFEHRLSALLYKLLKDPLGYMNIPKIINCELRKRDYLLTHLHSSLLTQDLRRFLGDGKMDEYFQEKNNNTQCFKGILSGRWSIPIHYALLLLFLDLDTLDTSVAGKVIALKSKGYVLTRDYVADMLGMKKTALIYMLQNEGDDLSWISNKYPDEYTEKAIFRCSIEEKERWKEQCENMHCANMSEFYRFYFIKGLEAERKCEQ